MIDWVSTGLLIGAGAIISALGYRHYRKRRKSKDKRPTLPTDDIPPALDFGKMKIDFSRDPSLNKLFIQVLRHIKQEDPKFYDKLTGTVKKWRLVDGYSKANKNYLGMAWASTKLIHTYTPRMNKELKSYKYRRLKFHLLMDHMVHETLHLLGFSHGPVMNGAKTRIIKRLGGKVDRPT